MSSEASTDEGLVAPKRDSANGLVAPKRDSAEAEALQPWQLFTLAGLIGATVVVFFSRGQSPIGIVLLSAAEAKASGSGRFCMGAAWREPKDRDMDALCTMVAGVKDRKSVV